MSSGDDVSGPSELGKRDYKEIARRTRHEIKNDHVSLLAAGIAFYAFLSLFPALTAVVSIYGLFADPAEVQQQVQATSGVLPEQAQGILQSQLDRIARSSGGALGLGAIIGLLAALWSANKATKGLFEALSAIYGREERRSFLKLNGQSFLMTLGMVIVAIASIFLIAVFPAIIETLGFGSGGSLATMARWPVLIGAVLVAFAVLYKYGPDRDSPTWQWMSPGALVATVLWLLASIGFAIYAQNFGSYNKMYGVLGAVVVLMLWLFISAYVVLIGGELNAEVERTASEGKRRAMGDAYADPTVS
jgi:membrane protein